FDPVAETVKGDPTPITTGSTLWQPMADVSPDGAWLAIASDQPRSALYLVRWDGNGLRQLTDDRGFNRVPKWSPDGRRIAFQSTRGGEWAIWTVNVDGSGLTQLTKGGGRVQCGRETARSSRF